MTLRRFEAFRRLVGGIYRSLSSEVSEHNEHETFVEDEEPTFAEMFRHSKFAQLGTSLDNRVVEGRVVKIIEKDMFVDFGGKFYGVVKRPGFRHQE